MIRALHDVFGQAETVAAVFSIAATAWAGVRYVLRPAGDWIKIGIEKRRKTLASIAETSNRQIAMQASLERIIKETSPNGGGSMKDVVNRVELLLKQNTLLTLKSLDLQSNVVWLASADGNRTWSSSAWQRITGLTEKQSEGNGWTLAIAEDDRDRVYREWITCCKEGRPFQASCRYVSDGSYRMMNLEAAPLKWDDGRIVCYFGQSREVAA